MCGASNVVVWLSEVECWKGLVIYFFGNYVQAVVFSVKMLGVLVYIVMLENVFVVKWVAIEGYGV